SSPTAYQGSHPDPRFGAHAPRPRGYCPASSRETRGCNTFPEVPTAFVGRLGEHLQERSLGKGIVPRLDGADEMDDAVRRQDSGTYNRGYSTRQANKEIVPLDRQLHPVVDQHEIERILIPKAELAIQPRHC